MDRTQQRVVELDDAGLLALAADLSAAATPHEVINVVTAFCLERFGVDRVALVVPDTTPLLGERTYGGDGATIWHEQPLVSADLRVGRLRLGWSPDREVDPAVLQASEALAVVCAGALHRALLARGEVVARERAEGSARRLRTLQDVAAELAHVLDIREAARVVLTSVLGTVGADVAVLHLFEDDGRYYRRVEMAGGGGLEEGGEPMPVTENPVALQLLREHRAVITDASAGGPARPGGKSPITWAHLPLATGGTVTGFVSYGWWADHLVDGDELAVLQALTDHLAAAVERARLNEANESLIRERTWVAATLQRSLLPPPLPKWDHLEMAAGYEPAQTGTQVCGDFYDAFIAPDRSLIVVIGDVAGRGIEAAGLTGLARHTLRALAMDMRPAEALRRLNAAVMDASFGEEQRLLTAAVVRFHHDGTVVVADIALAGHCLPVLVHGRTAEQVGTPGVILGATAEPYISETEVRLDVGDMLMLHTDGVLEARRHGEEFGEARLLRLLRALKEPAPAETVERVLGAVGWYRTTAPDDVAVLAMRVRPQAPASPV